MKILPVLLADIFFPSRCVSCGSPVSLKDDFLCPSCREDVEIPAERCPRCSGPLDRGECLLCTGRAFYLTRNICAAEYSGAVKTSVVNMKFHRRRRLHRFLALLGRQAAGEVREEVDVVTFVPMHVNKKWKRGFNQSEIIGRVIARMMGKPFTRLLRENLLSIRQKDLAYRDRFINVLGRYRAVRRGKMAGKSVLIVDDVFTTGATVNECARILLAAGARSVFSLTIARAVPKKA